MSRSVWGQHWYPNGRLTLCVLLFSVCFCLVQGQCPWPRTPHHASLHSDCVCGYSNVRRLSVQCSPVANFSQLLEVLHSPSVLRLPIDLLYINNATGLSLLPKNAFKHLDIQQIHLANTRLDTIERGAFAGLEDKLLSLTLQSTGLKDIPIAEFRTLRSLRTLDLSQNRIRRVRADTFGDLGQLATLRLAFNADLQLDKDALVGLERSLKNLNLKAIGATQVPEAIRNLTELAFLDLAQNRIEEVQPRMFANLHSLTALSLERNLIRSVHPDTFLGLNDSLSSLSLLNNLLVEFPQKALSKLAGLRVLDLGFNAIRQLSSNAFQTNTLLTLLALDGNPLRTISLQTFQHLNATLRGISVGGKAFECDCKVRWLAEWAAEYSLQITSRERNPQFCSKPAHLRNKPFSQVDLSDFVCPPSHSLDPALRVGSSTVASSPSTNPPMAVSPTSNTETYPVVHYEHSSTLSTTSEMPPKEVHTNPSVVLRPATSYVQVIAVDEPSQGVRTRAFSTSSTTTSSSSSTIEITTNAPIAKIPSVQTTLVVHEPNTGPKSPQQQSPSPPTSELSTGNLPKSSSTRPRHRSNNGSAHRGPTHHQPNSQGSLRLQDAMYRNNTIWLRWEAISKPSSSGYQVVYRYFGSKEFHKSEPIGAKQNSYTLSHFIAPNELIVICVLNLDDSADGFDMPAETPIPTGQCRELTTRETIIKKSSRPAGSSSTTNSTTSLSSLYPSLKRLNDIDKIVIAISAAVCLFIIMAVLVFSCCFYRSVSKESPLRTVLATTNAKCLSNKSLSPMTKSSLDHEWETVSVYSTRSIPRARIAAHLAQQHPPMPPPTITGTIRSHISAHGAPSNGTAAPITRYFGSTLPSKPNPNRNPWLESYLNHYPSVSHLPVVSYGTTVTATGGGANGAGNGYFSDSSFARNVSSLAREHHREHRSRGHHEKVSSSSSSSNNQQHGHHRNRKPNKSRLKSSSNSKMMIPSTELRLHGATSGGSGGAASGSSYNRLLLSSSSNSFQSQNEYDSDNNNNHWNGHGSYVTNSRMFGASSRMNDNEVDIYVDQNYARRFI